MQHCVNHTPAAAIAPAAFTTAASNTASSTAVSAAKLLVVCGFSI